MSNSVGVHQLPMPLNPPVESRSDAEYHFVGWLHDQKYQCEGVQFRWDILGSKYVDGVEEETIRFEVSVFAPSGDEKKAYTKDTAKKTVNEVRERFPAQSIAVKLWHWTSPVALPPLDDERLRGYLINLRKRHLKQLWKIMSARSECTSQFLKRDDIVRGVLDAVLFESEIDFSRAASEHEVRNVVLASLGKPPEPFPEPWEHDVVFQFADGGEVVVFDGSDTSKFEATLAQEKLRRKKARLTFDGFLRRRLKDDRFVLYIHPPPSRGRKRKQALQPGECADGAGI